MLERHRISSPDGATRAQIVASDSLIFLSGMHPDSTEGDIGGQVQEVLDRIGAMLLDRGAGRDRLMMVQVWLADIGDLPGFSTVWNGWIDPQHPPALSVVQGAASRRDTLVEIRAWAAPAA